MAPIKFEEQIKNKLEQRAINPEENAWDKLAERLDTQERKKTINPYWWLGIAASVIIIVVVNHFVSNNVNSNPISPIQIVIDEATQKNDIIPEIENKTIVVSEDKIVESESKIETKSNINKPDTKPNRIAEVKTSTVVKNRQVENRKDFNIESEQDVKHLATPSKLQSTIAAIETKDNTVNNNLELDSEIEALLGEAKENIASKTTETKAKATINPDGLLDEIEFDLDQSFRDKVFQKLKSSYKKVSTAVAHRND